MDALLEACLKKDPGEADWFLRPMKDENEDILPGLRRRSKIEPRSEASSAKLGRVGESVTSGAGACCSSLESKNGSDSSKESDFGRGMAPLTVVASSPWETSLEIRKSMASFNPPALLRVYPRTSRSWGCSPSSSSVLGASEVASTTTSTSYCSLSFSRTSAKASGDFKKSWSSVELRNMIS